MPKKLLTIEDLRFAAKKRIPKLAFDYLSGGAGEERNIHRNRASFDNILLCPEYIISLPDREQKVKIFDHIYNGPIGISPMGLANLIWPKADTILAKAANKRNVPYILSAVGTSSIEEIADIAPNNTWFQLYVPQEEHICFELIRRAKQSGIKVLVVTVDVPYPSKRLRDWRNDFSLPFKIKPSLIFDVLSKPQWLTGTLKNGTPRFKNLIPYMKDAFKGKPLSAAQILQASPNLDKALLKRIRDEWDGPLVVKGILSPKTALVAESCGVDGIIVSNHGGRQLNSAPSSIEALPYILKVLQPKTKTFIDSGIRGGEDVIKAFAMGAHYTFSGRSFMFGVGALGPLGGEHVLDIFADEIDRILAQIGCPDINVLDQKFIWPPIK